MLGFLTTPCASVLTSMMVKAAMAGPEIWLLMLTSLPCQKEWRGYSYAIGKLNYSSYAWMLPFVVLRALSATYAMKMDKRLKRREIAFWISAATTNIGSKKYNQQAGWRNVQMTKWIWIDGYGCSCCMKRFFQLLYRTVLHFRSLETHLRTWDTCRCSVYSKSPKDLQKREHLLYINMTNSELNCVQSSSLKDMHLFPSPEIRKASCVSHQWCIQAFLLCWTRRVICLSINC